MPGSGSIQYMNMNGLGELLAKLRDYLEQSPGKGLSQNDYTDADKDKLASLAAVAVTGSYNDLIDLPEQADIQSIPSGAVDALFEG
ncbi:MAG: hypothetical protein LBH66_06225 [Oscillospiraceae bacterium]|jgi:hypothetical protein|nr:hypothetical protein [Oscillospiraceae bacterium]